MRPLLQTHPQDSARCVRCSIGGIRPSPGKERNGRGNQIASSTEFSAACKTCICICRDADDSAFRLAIPDYHRRYHHTHEWVIFRHRFCQIQLLVARISQTISTSAICFRQLLPYSVRSQSVAAYRFSMELHP